MKVNSLIIVMLSVLLPQVLFAQPGRGRSPEQRAQRQTQLMTDSLALSEAQTAKVGEVNLKYAKKMQEIRKSADGDYTAMREMMQSMRKEQQTELNKYLTAEQAAKWETIEAQLRERRGRRGGKGKRGKRRKAPESEEG